MTAVETERLYLRPWTEEDIAACHELAKDPEVGPMCGWLPHKDREETAMIVRKVLMKDDAFAIVRKEDGRLMGDITLKEMPDHCREFGTWLGKEFWGHGYIEEAAEALMHYGSVTLGVDTYYWNYFDGNRNSKRASEKLGFHEVKVVKDTARYLQMEVLIHVTRRDITWQDKNRWIEENASFSQQYQGYYGESDGTNYIDLLEEDEKK